MEVLNGTEESLRRIIPKSFRYSVLISIIIILSLAPVLGVFCERLKGEEFYSLEPPENLEVEHNGTAGEELLYPEEEIFSVNLEGEIEYLQHEPESDDAKDNWYESIYEGEDTDLTVALEEPSEELEGTQTIGILVRRTDNSDREPELSVELWQQDEEIDILLEEEPIEDPVEEIHHLDFEVDDLVDPSGEGVEFRFSGAASVGSPGDRNTVEYGAVEWEVTTLGGRNNRITWDASEEDPGSVTHYNVYRSEQEDGPWGEPIVEVQADDLADYDYIDEDRGTADDILWWYTVRAEDDEAQKSEDAGPTREPGPWAPRNPQPEDGATGVGPEEVDLSVYVEHSEEEITDTVTFYDASDDTVIGSVDDVEHGTRTAEITLDDLEEYQTYGWYVEAEGVGGTVASEKWEFTTQEEPPEITITRPAGGEEWNAGDEENIEWDSDDGDGDITGVDLYYSTDGGASWTNIVTDTTDDGVYIWVVPDETTEEAMIRGRVTDDNDLSHQNETDLFTIMGRPPAPPENLDVEHYGTDEENGTEDNLVTWDASPDDLEKVSQYNVYRAEEEDGDYEFVGSVDAEGAADYEYVDEDKGTADDTLWWYIVHSEDDYEQVCEGAGPAREPEPLAPTEPQPEDGWLSIWWPFLILVSAAFVAMAGGILYKKRSSTEEPVIEEIFLISKRNSMLILHNTRRLKPDRDSDIIAGMFESVQKFIEDSFQDAEDWTLNKMEFGDNKVLVERGEHVYMAVVYKGEFSEEKVQEIRDVIAKIEEEFGEQLEEWDGDRKEIQGIDNIIEELFS